MFCRKAAIALILVLILPVSYAVATPKQGFGLFGGIASHTSNVEITKGLLDGTKVNVASSGLSIGVDYQLPVADAVSINFFLMSSSETASGDQNFKADSAGHGILGVEGRYWFDALFVGAHVGSYSEVFTSTKSGSSTSTAGGGFGFGVSAGWTNEAGLFVMGQYDKANIAYSDAKADLTGLRVQVGYRWGK